MLFVFRSPDFDTTILYTHTHGVRHNRDYRPLMTYTCPYLCRLGPYQSDTYYYLLHVPGVITETHRVAHTTVSTRCPVHVLYILPVYKYNILVYNILFTRIAQVIDEIAIGNAITRRVPENTVRELLILLPRTRYRRYDNIYSPAFVVFFFFLSDDSKTRIVYNSIMCTRLILIRCDAFTVMNKTRA